MTEKTIVLPSTELHIIGDVRDVNVYYCMDKENSIIWREVLELHGRREKKVPNEFTVKCRRLEIVKETDTHTFYDVISDTVIEFPVNQSKEVFIRVPNVETTSSEGFNMLLKSLSNQRK
jgi:hypothetical protein